jgi:hypothetical protein
MQDLKILLDEKKIFWKSNQICLNSTPLDPDNFTLGTGSLTRNWDSASLAESNSGQKLVIDQREVELKETDFTHFCDVFRNTEFERVYDFLAQRYTLGRVKLMKMDPKQCYTWHIDQSKKVHYVLTTSKGAFFVVNDEMKHLEQDSWYHIDTTVPHTVFNGSLVSRIHLVASVL